MPRGPAGRVWGDPRPGVAQCPTVEGMLRGVGDARGAGASQGGEIRRVPGRTSSRFPRGRALVTLTRARGGGGRGLSLPVLTAKGPCVALILLVSV